MEDIKEQELPSETEGSYIPPIAKNPVQQPELKKSDEVVEMEDFDFGNYQVVRREFFAHINEPSITFNNYKFSANAACIKRFPNAEYAQVLINREQKILALRPCEEFARDSFPWARMSKGKRTTKAITCKLFFAKIFDMMQWIPEFRYKLLGKVIHSNGEYLLAFDLTSTEVYKRTNAIGEKPKSSRTPIFPYEWQNQFGMPYYEHQKSMQIDKFEGYAIYSIKETKTGKTITQKSDETLPLLIEAPENVIETKQE